MLKLTSEIELPKAEKVCGALCDLLGQTENLSAELAFEDAEGIKALNRQFRNKDETTDVLSFPSLDLKAGEIVLAENFPYDVDNEDGSVFLGSIVICESRAKEQAEEYGHSVEREVYYLLCHALLHLFGYDHMTEEDKKIMREFEEKALLSAGIAR